MKAQHRVISSLVSLYLQVILIDVDQFS